MEAACKHDNGTFIIAMSPTVPTSASFRSSEAMLTLRWQRSKLINLGASVRRCPFDHTGHKPLLRVDYITS